MTTFVSAAVTYMQTALVQKLLRCYLFVKQARLRARLQTLQVSLPSCGCMMLRKTRSGGVPLPI